MKSGRRPRRGRESRSGLFYLGVLLEKVIIPFGNNKKPAGIFAAAGFFLSVALNKED